MARIATLWLLALLPAWPAVAGEGASIRESPFAAGQYDVYENGDPSGRRLGEVRPDPFRERSYDVLLSCTRTR
jgi:hypothetical protein